MCKALEKLDKRLLRLFCIISLKVLSFITAGKTSVSEENNLPGDSKCNFALRLDDVTSVSP